MHVGVRIFVHLISVFPVALAALSMLLSRVCFLKEQGKGWCTLLGCVRGWDVENSGSSGREELGGAEEMLQPRGEFLLVFPTICHLPWWLNSYCRSRAKENTGSAERSRARGTVCSPCQAGREGSANTAWAGVKPAG